MSKHLRLFSLVVVVLVAMSTQVRAEQTIVFFRHAEKMTGGYGQLTCQGLNRALALPTILVGNYGKADYLYAPNPASRISESAGSFYYVRPLATVEPTAIRLGKSVNTHYGYTEIGSLQSLLITSTKADATIFVAWEHTYLQKIVQNIMTRYGDGAIVPAWTSGDYDSLYVVRVTYVAGSISARFEIEHEGLNDQPATCPN